MFPYSIRGSNSTCFILGWNSRVNRNFFILGWVSSRDEISSPLHVNALSVVHHYFSITFKFHNLHLKKHLGNITLVNTTQFFCQAQKPSLQANFGALISEMPTIFPSTSSCVCTNFVKFTNFYDKCQIS